MNLAEQLNSIGVQASSEQIDLLTRYMEMILDRNQHINLTAIKDPDEFLLRHYVDSAAVMNIPEYQEAGIVLDLGTGAGFPGVPLAILSPDKEFVLLDSLRKRLNVIEEFCGELGIHNVKVLHARAEDAGRDKKIREKMDLCVSRAVADLSVLSEYCLPVVRKGGAFIAYKGSDVESEAREAQKAIRVLGGKLDRIKKVSVQGMEHSLLVIHKNSKTPAQYPRKAGTPAKSPIK